VLACSSVAGEGAKWDFPVSNIAWESTTSFIVDR